MSQSSSQPQPRTPLRAAVYYRMSSDKQESSIARQKSLVEPFLDAQRLTLVRAYEDEGIAGDEVTRRKAFRDMLRDAGRGLFDVIVCDDKDRFGRLDSIDMGEVVAPLRRQGIRLITVAQGPIDWESFAGRVTDAVLQEAKHLESRANSRRVLSGQLLAARQGIPTGGRAPYGLRWAPHPTRRRVLVPDDRKAEVVRFIFEQAAAGRSLRQISEALYRRGVASPRGGPRWSRTSLLTVLSNRKYLGDWVWGVQTNGKYHQHTGGGKMTERARSDKRFRRNDEDGWLTVSETHEALVSREQFVKARAHLKGRRKTRDTRPGEAGAFALSRLLVCTHCGHFLGGTTDRGRREYVCGGYAEYGRDYCHRNAVSEPLLLRVLVAKLQFVFLDPEKVAQLREEVRQLEAAERGEDNVGRLRRRLADLDAKIKQGSERVLTVPADVVPGIVKALQEAQAERTGLRAELTRLETSSRVRDLEERLAVAEAQIWKLQEAIEGDDHTLLRDVFWGLITKVELRYEHRPTARRSRSRLVGGVIHLATGETNELTFVTAGHSERSLVVPFSTADLDHVA
jgi:site-specific DNA recombinase